MGLLICPKCQKQTGVIDKNTTISPDCHDLKLTFKCTSCKDVFVAVYNLKEFWFLDKGVVPDYYACREELIKQGAKKEVKEEAPAQLKLF